MTADSLRPKILCVDDEAPGLYFRKLILERQGYRVVTATSADDGIELVVTDHLMGRATGTKMAAEIRRLKPDIPIIVFSGTTNIPEGLESADFFLPKTVRSGETAGEGARVARAKPTEFRCAGGAGAGAAAIQPGDRALAVIACCHRRGLR